jgi:REase_AHJR-like
MNAIQQQAFDAVLERARIELEREGYRVLVRPQGIEVPPFLEGYEPDIVARKGEEGGVVVGIKPVPPSQRDNRRAAYFAKEVRKHPGWHFHLYLARPQQEDLDAPLQPGKIQLVSDWRTANQLARGGNLKAAIAYAWGLLEATARHLTLDEKRGQARRHLPASVVGALVSDGFIDDAQGNRLHEIAAVRNRIVHGFTRTKVAKAEVEFLLKTIRALIDEIPRK